MYGFRTKLAQFLTKATIVDPYIAVSSKIFSNTSAVSQLGIQISCIPCRLLAYSSINFSSDKSNSPPNIGEYDTLTEYHAYDMIHKLSDNDRASLSKALSKYNSDKIKSKFQGRLIFCMD